VSGRDSQIIAEVVRTNADAKARESQLSLEVFRGNADARARVSQLAIEVLHARVRPSMAVVWIDDAEEQ
jgi:hypothetical protein